jgi:hypothetical protein
MAASAVRPGGTVWDRQLAPPSVERKISTAEAAEEDTAWPLGAPAMASHIDFVGQEMPVNVVTPEGSISPTRFDPPSVVRRATAPAPPATQIEVDGQARALTL